MPLNPTNGEGVTVAPNPTELNRQGLEVGSHYRSALFDRESNQKWAATRAQRQRSPVHTRPVGTKVLPLRGFHPAAATTGTS